MRYAIISDIHSNLEALEVVLKKIDLENIDEIVCLGDIVGYGPNPNECIKLTQQNCSIILSGNHDFACFDNSELSYFNKYAKKSIEWTLDNISSENLNFLATLQIENKINNFHLVHSSPSNPKAWNYIISIEQAKANFSDFEGQICFIGHSHNPVIFIKDNTNKVSLVHISKLKINQKEKYLINVGSVGQPRDGNPNAAFGILDTVEQIYSLKRVDYDIEKTHKKMSSTKLPIFLADRLLTGK